MSSLVKINLLYTNDGNEVETLSPREEGLLLIMDYTGMLRPKGVPFWAPGMGKGYLFHAGGMRKEYLFRERYVKGCQFPKFSL